MTSVLNSFKNEQLLETMIAQKEACVQDNRHRLKLVRNLDDLISFKVSTLPQADPHPSIHRANTTDPSIAQFRQMLAESQTLNLQAAVPPPSEAIDQPVKTLKKLFNTQEFKRFKVRHHQETSSKIMLSQRERACKSQLQSIREQEEAAIMPQTFRQDSTQSQLKKYVQKLEQLKERTQSFEPPQFDEYMNLSEKDIKQLKRQQAPAHIKLKNQLSHLQQYQTAPDPEHAQQQQQRMSIREKLEQKYDQAKPGYAKSHRSKPSKLIEQLHGDPNYLKYPGHFREYSDLNHKQNEAVAKVELMKSQRELYQTQRQNYWYTPQTLPLKQQQQPHQHNASKLLQSSEYQPHVSDKYNKRSSQHLSSNSDFQRSRPQLMSQSYQVLSPINITKMQVVAKQSPQKSQLPQSTAQISAETKVNADIPAQSHSQERSQQQLALPTEESETVNFKLQMDSVEESNQPVLDPVDPVETQESLSKDDYATNLQIQVVRPVQKRSNTLLISETESVSTLNEQTQLKPKQDSMFQFKRSSVETEDMADALTQTQQYFKKKTRYESPMPFQSKARDQQLLNLQAQQKPPAFHASRFKKFPRFALSQQRQVPSNAAVISLNDGFLHLLSSAGTTTQADEPQHQNNTEYINTESSNRDLAHLQPPRAAAATVGEAEVTECQTVGDEEVPKLQMNIKDPFDEVMLEKYIDNALLTSSRTMSGLNNTISLSLKVIHTKFTPSMQHIAQFNGQLQGNDILKLKKGYQDRQLYDVVKEEPTTQDPTDPKEADPTNPESQRFYQYPLNSIEIHPTQPLTNQSPSNLTLEEPQHHPKEQDSFESAVPNLDSNYIDSRQLLRKTKRSIPSKHSKLSKQIVVPQTRNTPLLLMDNPSGQTMGTQQRSVRQSKDSLKIHQIELAQGFALAPMQNQSVDEVCDEPTVRTKTLLSSCHEFQVVSSNQAHQQQSRGFEGAASERTTVLNVPTLDSGQAATAVQLVDEEDQSPLKPQMQAQNNQTIFTQQEKFSSDEHSTSVVRPTPQQIIEQMKLLLSKNNVGDRVFEIIAQQDQQAESSEQQQQQQREEEAEQGIRVMIPQARLTDLGDHSPLTEMPKSRGAQSQNRIKRVAGFNKTSQGQRKGPTTKISSGGAFGLIKSSTLAPSMVDAQPPRSLIEPSSGTLINTDLHQVYNHKSGAENKILYLGGDNHSSHNEIREQSNPETPRHTKTGLTDEDIETLIKVENIKIMSRPAKSPAAEQSPNNHTEQLTKVPTEDEKITKRILEMDGQLGGNGRQLKAMIDKLYSKEKQFVYTALREEILGQQSIIFDLRKAHQLNIAPTDPSQTSQGKHALQPQDLCLIRGTKMPMSQTQVSFKSK